MTFLAILWSLFYFRTSSHRHLPFHYTRQSGHVAEQPLIGLVVMLQGLHVHGLRYSNCYSGDANVLNFLGHRHKMIGRRWAVTVELFFGGGGGTLLVSLPPPHQFHRSTPQHISPYGISHLIFIHVGIVRVQLWAQPGGEHACYVGSSDMDRKYPRLISLNWLICMATLWYY